MTYRDSIVASDFQELIAGLSQESRSFGMADATTAMTFIFTGQGAQWAAMGMDLVRTESAFRASLVRSAGMLMSLGATWDLMGELKAGPESSQIYRSEIAQPCTTAIQIALVDLLESLSIQPNAVIGHSSGEIAAAYAAGALGQCAALKVAFRRGLISKICAHMSHAEGAMLAVGLGENAARQEMSRFDSGYLAVACANSPESTTISGEVRAISRLKDHLDKLGVFNRRLNVDLAYHSDLIKVAASEYESALQDLEHTSSKTSVKYFSTVTADIKSDDFGPSYWTQNLTSKVNFQAALETYKEKRKHSFPGSDITDPLHIFLELGPHSALSSAVRQNYGSCGDAFKFLYQPTIVRGQPAAQTINCSLAKLFKHGVTVDVEALNLLVEPVTPRFMIQDLPGYQWDHSLQFWHESRLSLEHRQRRFPPHDLLGLAIVGNGPFEHAWSNYLSIEDQPWLQDHRIDSFITFPAAAYLCMAMEALNQAVSDHQSPQTFLRHSFRHISFLKALVLSDTGAKLEILLRLRQSQHDGNRSTEGWWDFQICSRNSDGTWAKNCRGSILLEYQPTTDTADSIEIFDEDQLQASAQMELLRRIENTSKEKISSSKLYSEMASKGNEYGETFALLDCIEIGDLHGIAEVKVSNMISTTVNPATLDALFHLVFPVFARHHSAASIVPIAAKDMVLSNNFPNSVGSTLRVVATVYPRSSQTFEASIVAFHSHGSSNPSPVLSLTAEFQAIGDIHERSTGTTTEKMAWSLDYAQDVDFLAENWLVSHQVNPPSNGGLLPAAKHRLLLQATAQYIANCLGELSTTPPEPSEPHLKHLLSWMQRYASLDEFQDLLSSDPKPNDLDRDTLGVEGEALSRIGNKISSIIKGKENPLELLLENDLLYRVYGDDSSLLCCQRLVEYMKLLTFKHPYLTVLEIGAGTGGATLPILQALSQVDSTRLKRYDFTDIATSFFEPAKKLLKQWSDVMSFKKLDIEKEPMAQGFEAGSYDLVIAVNVLHATYSMENTLSNVRKLLKPGGKLALIEITALVPYVNLVFGTLPGWWKGNIQLYSKLK